MDAATRQMIQGWASSYNGSIDKTARFIAYTLRIGTLPEARALVTEALDA